MSPKLALVLTPANIALLLLFASASLNFLAKYFYLYYRLLFGALYPSYSSYKAIKNKDLKEYVSCSSTAKLLIVKSTKKEFKFN
jgi:hypothetical protein